MSWAVNLSKDAAKQYRLLPPDRQAQVGRAIEELCQDPLLGDVKPIKSGRFQGALRKRVGRYRIVFVLDTSNRQIQIGAILLRNESTYR